MNITIKESGVMAGPAERNDGPTWVGRGGLECYKFTDYRTRTKAKAKANVEVTIHYSGHVFINNRLVP